MMTCVEFPVCNPEAPQVRIREKTVETFRVCCDEAGETGPPLLPGT